MTITAEPSATAEADVASVQDVQDVPDVPIGEGHGPSASGEEELVHVKVWDLPVRMLHWMLVACIIVLSITGFYIATPLFGSSSASGYTMGIIRTIHIATGWVFATTLVARIYWAFAGNKWARWDQLIPVSRDRLKKIRPSVEYYLFRRLEAPPVVGHNPLAGATYVVLFIMFILQAITGFALEALSNPHGLLWDLTGWVYSILPIPYVRLFHYLVMFCTFGFIIHHVYSGALVDREERSGEISSMFTGWKILPRSRVEAEEAAMAAPRESLRDLLRIRRKASPVRSKDPA
ncbi:MAG: Ni/Fe-hydrogenase, b-type cytochrome subunit [Acidimicrobiales bacterium]|jgi:Ni/Fe-hydrogenase 1 B-type cytochrome subunit